MCLSRSSNKLSQAYLGPCQKSAMEVLQKILLTIFAKSSIIDIMICPNYGSDKLKRAQFWFSGGFKKFH